MPPKRVKLDAKVRAIFREFGRAGGHLGGEQRAKNLTAERRREIARKAAQARWHKRKSQ